MGCGGSKDVAENNGPKTKNEKKDSNVKENDIERKKEVREKKADAKGKSGKNTNSNSKGCHVLIGLGHDGIKLASEVMDELKAEIEKTGQGKDKFNTNGWNIRLFINEEENKPNTEYNVKTIKLSQSEFFAIKKDEFKSYYDELEKDFLSLGDIETITFFYNANCTYAWLVSSLLLPSFCLSQTFHNIVLPSKYDTNSLNCINTAKTFENAVESANFVNVIDQKAFEVNSVALGIAAFMSCLIYSDSSINFEKCNEILSPYPRMHFNSMIYFENDDPKLVSNDFVSKKNCYGPSNFLDDNRHGGYVAIFKGDFDSSVSKCFDGLRGYNFGVKDSLTSVNFIGKGNSIFNNCAVALIHHVKSIFGNNTWWESADSIMETKKDDFPLLKENYAECGEVMNNLQDLRTEYQQYVEN